MAKITIRRNGSYFVEGPITIIDSNGQEMHIEKAAFSLCRCGQSANKPFCDGTHKRCGFEGAEAHILAAEAAARAQAAGGGDTPEREPSDAGSTK